MEELSFSSTIVFFNHFRLVAVFGQPLCKKFATKMLQNERHLCAKSRTFWTALVCLFNNNRFYEDSTAARMLENPYYIIVNSNFDAKIRN